MDGLPIIRMELPRSQDEIHSYFVASDLHSYHLAKPAFRIMQRHARLVSNPALIINGDLFDLAFMMKKNADYKKWIKRPDGFEEFFIPAWEDECKVVNKILDVAQKTFVKVIFINGNHDGLRIEEFLKDVPHEYKHHFSYKEKLKLKERGIPTIDYGVWLDIGKVSLIHGLYHNKQCHKTHHEDCGKSLIFGHIHKGQMVPFKQRGKTHHVWSLPCMSTLNPDYMRKRTNDWDNGYGLLHVDYKGKFSFNLYTIWNNQLILPNGTILKENG